MAKMFPENFPEKERDDEKISRVEPLLFDLFEKQLDDSYTVIYGKNWYLQTESNKINKNNGEIDFTIIHRIKGIIVIEAKSGSLQYLPESGKWKLEGGRKIKESPLEQAKRNRYALSQKIANAFRTYPDFPQIKYCFALALPECKYEVEFEPLDLPKDLFLDINNCSNINQWINGVYEYYNSQEESDISEFYSSIIDVITGGSIYFSSPLKNQLVSMGKIIDKLTTKQYEILDHLQEHKRANITGCAGSGKTLIAVEKAIRLSKLNQKVLLLAHNPNLVKYLLELTKDTIITVKDLCSWIYEIINQKEHPQSNWTYYQEPTKKELNLAFDILADSSEKYDAIIVDEGQDFRDEWWTIVETALKDIENSTLYIFFDDNQALLPQRAKYPIKSPPIKLLKNCRNTGEIFELVRRLHPQAPETVLELKKLGVVKYYNDINQAIVEAVRKHKIDIKSLIVLTIESEPVENSILNNTYIELKPLWIWQDVVCEYINKIFASYLYSFQKEDININTLKSNLSNYYYPSEEDIEKVVSFVRQNIEGDLRRHIIKNFGHQRKGRNIKWSSNHSKLFLTGHSQSPHVLCSFFSSKNWVDSFPKLEKIRISNNKNNEKNSLFLSTVTSYKGLESDGVILFVNNAHTVHDLDANFYVGISRAKFILYIVGDTNSFLPL